MTPGTTKPKSDSKSESEGIIMSTDPVIDINAAVKGRVQIYEALSEPTVGALRMLLGRLEQLGLGQQPQQHSAQQPQQVSVRDLLRRAGEVNQAATQLQQQAAQAVTAAHAAALKPDVGPAAALAGVADALREAAPWTAPAPGVDSPAAAQARHIARAATQQAVYLMTTQAPDIYRALQTLAARAVATTEAAVLPPNIWGTSEPAKTVMRSEYPEAWTQLLKAADDFERVHEAAHLLRLFGGGGGELPGSAVRHAWRFRAWRKAQEEADQIRPVATGLRLRWIVEHGWLPGLWRSDQIDPTGDPAPTPERRSLLDRLRS
jgi:hypothetical protein